MAFSACSSNRRAFFSWLAEWPPVMRPALLNWVPSRATTLCLSGPPKASRLASSTVSHTRVSLHTWHYAVSNTHMRREIPAGQQHGTRLEITYKLDQQCKGIGTALSRQLRTADMLECRAKINIMTKQMLRCGKQCSLDRHHSSPDKQMRRRCNHLLCSTLRLLTALPQNAQADPRPSLTRTRNQRRADMRGQTAAGQWPAWQCPAAAAGAHSGV